MLVLDTHVLLWFVGDGPRLGKRSRQLTTAALNEQRLCVSAISFWEIAMLTGRTRSGGAAPPSELRADMLAGGIRELPLTGDAAIAAAGFGLHGDPADRLIAATAWIADATLVTADERLLEWQHPLRRHDARR
jgi:PIN domain nuclease of toxin-antitoxin system